MTECWMVCGSGGGGDVGRPRLIFANQGVITSGGVGIIWVFSIIFWG